MDEGWADCGCCSNWNRRCFRSPATSSGLSVLPFPFFFLVLALLAVAPLEVVLAVVGAAIRWDPDTQPVHSCHLESWCDGHLKHDWCDDGHLKHLESWCDGHLKHVQH